MRDNNVDEYANEDDDGEDDNDDELRIVNNIFFFIRMIIISLLTARDSKNYNKMIEYYSRVIQKLRG